MAIVLGAAIWILPAAAQTQDAAKHYYHVQKVTTGCQNPAAVRLLTNPRETTTADARRLRSIRSSGHCVTITPRSQWSYLWRENDVAMMSYAGKIGRPGSYYLKADELVDADGQHPGELDVDVNAPISPTRPNEGIASTPAGATAKPAEVPTIIPPTTPPPQAASAAAPDKSIDQLINKADSTPPSFTPPQQENASASRPDPRRSQILVPAVCLALVVGALGLYAVLRGRNGKPQNYELALDIALGEIQAQATALREAKADSTRPDRYGTLRSDGWEREKASFIDSRIAPRLREAGYENMLPSLAPAIDTEIERRANSLVEPSLSDTNGAGHLNGGEPQAVDAELSDYASRCAARLQSAGWTTDPSPAAYSKAVDIFAERDGRKLLLQCKGGGAPVGVEAVQQVFTLKDRRHADIAAIITHAPFTRAAQQMASANGVHALHDEDLMQLIQ